MDATSSSCLTFSSNNVDTLSLLFPFISECLSIASHAPLAAPIYYCYRFNTIIINAVLSHISIPYVPVLFIYSSILFFTLICHSKKQQKYRIPFFFLFLSLSLSIYWTHHLFCFRFSILMFNFEVCSSGFETPFSLLFLGFLCFFLISFCLFGFFYFRIYCRCSALIVWGRTVGFSQVISDTLLFVFMFMRLLSGGEILEMN